jgi:TolB-like protein/AraC-like DNA-binding protein
LHSFFCTFLCKDVQKFRVMAKRSPGDQEFIRKLTEITLLNLENEDFGGRELALGAGLSYATLNRRLHAVTNKQINQFIREVRLQEALKMLLSEDLSVAEVAYRAGFGSPSYFNKCFHRHFGRPPGEIKKTKGVGLDLSAFDGTDKPAGHGVDEPAGRRKEGLTGLFSRDRLLRTLSVIAGLVILIASLFTFFYRPSKEETFSPLPPGTPEKSIAVLPFSNFTGNSELDYFVSGVHDALIGELGKIKALLVKSRTSTLPYRSPECSITEIAQELGVHYLVEGSVLGSEDSLQILIQLIETFPRERHVWSNSYAQNWGNLMGIYRDVTRQIAQQINIELEPGEERLLNKERTINPELNKAYMLGIYHLSKLTDEGSRLGMRYLNEAIAIDSLDPLPYLGLATIYSNMGHVTIAGVDAHKLAAEYAIKALALDSSLAEAHAVMATYYLYHKWDFEETEKALNRALKINPNIALVRYTNGWYSYMKGDEQLAVLEMQKAIQIDPLDPICTGYLGWLYLWLGLYDEAIEQARNTLEINPDYTMGHYVLGASLAEQGRYGEAIQAHLAGLEKSENFICGLGVAYARAGMPNQALEVAAKMEQVPNAWNAWGLSDLYATLGDNDKAMFWVAKAYELRQDFIPWMLQNPYYRPLYNEPAFLDIVAKLNLPG